MSFLFSFVLASHLLVPDYASIQRDYHAGLISGPQYASRLARAIEDPRSVPPSALTPVVGRGICLTPLVLEALQAAQGDPSAQELARLFFRPPKQASYVSPEGLFTIHYDTTGQHAVYQPTVDVNPQDGVPDYVNRCAEFFERAWRVEVDTLGFDPPGSDLGLGGSTNYDVYLHSYEGAYGVTFPEGPAAEYPGRRAYYSHIFVDPRFSGFGYANPLLPLKVTAAHEFNHACQFSYDTFEDVAWMEHCATWVEDVVYDEVNDYVAYLPAFFNSPHSWLYSSQGYFPYAACVWAHFLDQRFGRPIIERTWQHCISTTAQQAVHLALVELGSTRDAAVTEFRVWNFFTGSRDDGAHYEEGRSWPMVPLMTDHPSLPAEGGPAPGQTPGALACNYLRLGNLSGLDSVRIHFQGQANRVWAVSAIGLGSGQGALWVDQVGLAGGAGTDVFGLEGASSVILVPTCLSLASGTYTYWARDASQIFELQGVLVVERGDGDGRVEPGESFGLGLTLLNVAAQWAQARVLLTTSDPSVTVLSGTASVELGELGTQVVVPAESLVVAVSPAVEYATPLFTVSVLTPEGTLGMTLSCTVPVGTPPVLLVDDDGGDGVERYVAATLESLAVAYEVWDDHAGLFPALPNAALDLNPYRVVVWITGNAGRFLDGQDVARIQEILARGGHLMLSGQDMAESLSTGPEGQALLQTLGLAFDGKENLHGILGVSGDPLFDGMKFATAGSGMDGANNQTSQDRLRIVGSATPCLVYQTQAVAMARVEVGEARVLFAGFGVEAVVDNNPSVNTRRQFMAKALDYLFNGLAGAPPGPSVVSLVRVWPNPCRGVVHLATEGGGPWGRVWLTDLVGRRVAELPRAVLSPVALPPQVGSGTYLLWVEEGERHHRVPVVVMR